jgi:very-short-patch-repair endonuclease
VKLAIEVLGYDSRKSRESLDYEVERTRRLVVAGWTVLPATWTHVKYQPDRVASDVLARLGALRYSFGR